MEEKRNAHNTTIIKTKRFQLRKAWFEKHIKSGSHTLEEVCGYITEVCGFKEVHELSREYQEEYTQARLSCIMQHAPELLGEYAHTPKLASRDAEAIKKFIQYDELRQQAANQVPRNTFDIDFHLYRKESDGVRMLLSVELKYGTISGGAGGSKKALKEYAEILRNVYRYYGVTQEDIDQKTTRYRDLVRVLADR